MGRSLLLLVFRSVDPFRRIRTYWIDDDDEHRWIVSACSIGRHTRQTTDEFRRRRLSLDETRTFSSKIVSLFLLARRRFIFHVEELMPIPSACTSIVCLSAVDDECPTDVH
jgi:hypothetical protein